MTSAEEFSDKFSEKPKPPQKSRIQIVGYEQGVNSFNPDIDAPPPKNNNRPDMMTIDKEELAKDANRREAYGKTSAQFFS